MTTSIRSDGSASEGLLDCEIPLPEYSWIGPITEPLSDDKLRQVGWRNMFGFLSASLLHISQVVHDEPSTVSPRPFEPLNDDPNSGEDGPKRGDLRKFGWSEEEGRRLTRKVDGVPDSYALSALPINTFRCLRLLEPHRQRFRAMHSPKKNSIWFAGSEWLSWHEAMVGVAQDASEQIVLFNFLFVEFMYRGLSEYDPEGEENAAEFIMRERISDWWRLEPKDVRHLWRMVQIEMIALPSDWPESRAGAMLTECGYLGLMIDRGRREVRRKGYAGIVVTIGGVTDWHTFAVAFDAGARGANEEEWRKGYPGTWAQRRKRKAAVQEKLSDLNVAFEERKMKLMPLNVS